MAMLTILQEIELSAGKFPLLRHLYKDKEHPRRIFDSYSI